MSIRYYIFYFLTLFATVAFAQQTDSISRKKIQLLKITESPKIDGILDDLAWQNAPIAKDFVENRPNNGKPVADSVRTEVKIVYDDKGIYFGAKMYDPEPEKIMTELTERDDVGNVDFFYVLLNGYNDRQQSFEILVSSAGVQYDAKLTNGNEDPSWNGVWYSGVKINNDSWTAEIYVPYSEIRFPDKEIQVWGLNMERELRRTRTRYSWNHIDNSKGAFSIYDGEIHGIEHIDPPTRLSFQPYLAGYVNDYDGDSEVVLSGGLDLKYGITDAFTLDMILIPDFGQTKFDNAVLNLSAFEVQYAEQRPFFTEGTEMFTKGNLFYSRRVGGFPSLGFELGEQEEITNYPSKVDLINALKISGRTEKNLGIGVFNAITERTYAKIKNNETGETRKALVEPLTNYNVFVLDQRFGENNSVSFVNTNAFREGKYRDANASGLYFDLTNKKNTWNYSGNIEGTWINDNQDKFGFEGNLYAGKISGKHRFETNFFLRTKDYNIDDLGYTGQTNYYFLNTYYGYRILQPKGIFNSYYLNFNLNSYRRLDPDLYYNFIFNFNSEFTTKKIFVFGGGFEMTPFGTYDIYEPRIEKRYVKQPTYYDPWVWISTDYRKKLALDATLDWYKFDRKGSGKLIVEFSPRYRFSDKLKFYLNTQTTLSDKEQGFVDYDGTTIYFGERDRNTVEVSLESQYIFNNTMALNLAFRHYYSEVIYNQFYTLEQDGELIKAPEYTENNDMTYNTWNVDLRFNWWFAPGSRMTLLYRNAMESYADQSGVNFRSNFDYLFDQPQLNSISISLSYYLDYNRMKGWFGKKKQVQENETHISYAKWKANPQIRNNNQSNFY